MNIFKKLCTWMETLERFNIEKKKMRREDRLGEVDYATLNKQDEEQCINLQNDTKQDLDRQVSEVVN